MLKELISIKSRIYISKFFLIVRFLIKSFCLTFISELPPYLKVIFLFWDKTFLIVSTLFSNLLDAFATRILTIIKY